MKCFIWADGDRKQYVVFTYTVSKARQIMRNTHDFGPKLENLIADEPEIRKIPKLLTCFDPNRLLWSYLP